MHGVLLVGGSGTRLRPTTLAVNKHLLHVYDKPMIFYPLTTLVLAGVTHVTVVCNQIDESLLRKLLGDGSEFGLSISFVNQAKPDGIGSALALAVKNSGDTRQVVILGDNIFHGQGLGRHLSDSWPVEGAAAFGYRVADPRPYGVAVLNESGEVTRFIEKPVNFESNIAVTGLYFFDESLSRRVHNLTPSARGEVEVTSLLNDYLSDGKLNLNVLPRGTAWMDAGTNDSLLECANYIRIVQDRTAQLIGDPKEAARAMGLID